MKQESSLAHNESYFAKGCMKAAMAMLFLILLFLFIHGFSVMDQADFVAANVTTRWQYVAVFVAFAFVCMLFYLLWNVLGLFGKRQLGVLTWILFVGMLAVQCAFLLYFRSMYLWDEAFVVGGANSLIETGRVSQDAFYYLSIYPNQHPFVVVTSGLLWIGRRLSLSKAGQYLLLNAAGTICLDTAVVFVLKCQTYLLRSADPLMRARKRCFLLLLICLNPFVYVFAAYYYTISLSLPFFMCGMFFSLKVLGGNRRYVLPAGILFGMGYALRPTTVIPVAACVLTGFVVSLFKKDARRFGHSCLLLSVSLLTGFLLCQGSQRLVGIDTTDTAFPTSHWLMMSLTSPGNHNEEDEAFTASFVTKEEKRQAVSRRLVNKLRQLGIRGYAHLAVDKLTYTWESGSHAYGFYTGNTLRTGGFYRWVYGNRRDALALYGQGYYLFLLSCMLCVICRFWVREPAAELQKLTCPLFFFLLTILGGILFYILWETGTQYSLVFFPLFFLTASFAYGTGHAFGEIGSVRLYKMQDGRRESLRSLLHGNAAGHRELPIVMVLMAAVFALFTLWMWKERPAFTARAYMRDETRLLQVLANTPHELGDGEVLLQEFEVDRPFDKMIFQYRNFSKEGENDSVYQVVLRSSSILWEDTIIAKEEVQNAAFVKKFELLPAGRYELLIRKTDGSADNNLSFVTYRMGGYDAYTNGDLLLNGQKLEQDLMMGLYQTSTSAYATLTGYCGFWLVCFVCFLFWEICCILMGKCDIKE